MLKHLIGAGLITLVAFVIRFRVLPRTLDIYVHDTYIVVTPRVSAFWLLLAVAAVWLVFAAFKFHRRNP